MKLQRHFAMNYKACSMMKLSSFLLARGLATKESQKSYRKGVIEALREADGCASFRFLDLPAELRNRIYLDLSKLKYRHSSRSGSQEMHCFPQILRASRKVHLEAKAVLYGPEDVINVAVEMPFDSFEVIRGRQARPSTTVNGRKREIKAEWNVYGEQLNWPAFLGKFEHMRLEISIQTPNLYVAACKTNLDLFRDALLDLHIFLYGYNKLKKLQISLESDEMEADERWKDVLGPLRFFGGEKTFSFDGIPDEVSEYVQEASAEESE